MLSARRSTALLAKTSSYSAGGELSATMPPPTGTWTNPSFAIIVQAKNLPLLVVNTEREEVIQWIN